MLTVGSPSTEPWGVLLRQFLYYSSPWLLPSGCSQLSVALQPPQAQPQGLFLFGSDPLGVLDPSRGGAGRAGAQAGKVPGTRLQGWS